MNRTGSKLNSQAVAQDLHRVLLRFRAGLISAKQAKEETAILQASLRAIEQAEIESKLDRIETILNSRRN